MSLKIKHVKQLNRSACGAAVLAMLYEHLGVKCQSQKTIWYRLKTTRPQFGGEYIDVTRMEEDFKNLNLNYIWGKALYDNPSKAIDLLNKLTKAGFPVIVIQRFRKTDLAGHFKIVLSVNKRNVIVNDPEKATGSTGITISDFMALWQPGGDEVKGGVFLIASDKKTFSFGKIYVSLFRSLNKSFSFDNVSF